MDVVVVVEVIGRPVYYLRSMHGHRSCMLCYDQASTSAVFLSDQSVMLPGSVGLTMEGDERASKVGDAQSSMDDTAMEECMQREMTSSSKAVLIVLTTKLFEKECKDVW